MTAIRADTARTYAFDFEDEDDFNVSMLSTFDHVVAVANASYPLYRLIGYVSADNKALEVDVTGGAAGEIVNLSYEWWHEDL